MSRGARAETGASDDETARERASLPRRPRRRVRLGVVGRSDLAAAAIWAAAHGGPDGDTEVAAIQPANADFAGYQAMLADASIDAVYLGLRGSELLAHALAALEHGIHVLCEEPPASTAAHHVALARAAGARDRAPIVTWRGALSPVHRAAAELARSNLLGVLREFSAVACSTESDAGALAAVCLSHARRLFPDEPNEVVGLARCGSTAFVSVALRFPCERLALFTCGGGARASLRYDVVGSQGSLRVSCAVGDRGSDELVATLAGVTTQRRFPRAEAFAAELARFSAWVLRRDGGAPTLRDALSNARLFRALEQASELGGGVRLDAPSRQPRKRIESGRAGARAHRDGSVETAIGLRGLERAAWNAPPMKRARDTR